MKKLQLAAVAMLLAVGSSTAVAQEGRRGGGDPAQPREVGRWETPTADGRRLDDVSVADGVAYLAYWNDGLVILDVGNGIRNGRPDRPIRLTSPNRRRSR